MNPPRIFGIVGATASGKTAVAIELCEKLGGEVLSCDSMQIYKRLDILSAKPTKDEQARVRHHLVGILDPSEPCNAAAYRDLANAAYAEIQGRGKLPVLCGGTGLYVDALTKPMTFAEAGDESLRESLRAEGEDALYARLLTIDPEAAERIGRFDLRRLVRAMEIYTLTGKTQTEWAKLDAEREPPYDAKLFALQWSRETLYRRIDERVDRMVKDGLIDEVRALSRDEKPHPTALQALGYKEILSALRGEIALSDALERVKTGSRHYAKRQLTWFQRDARVIWLPTEHETAASLANQILSMIGE